MASDDQTSMASVARLARAARMTRRGLFKRAATISGTAVFGSAVASLLAACGGSSSSSSSSSASSKASSSSSTATNSAGARTAAAQSASTSSSSTSSAGKPVRGGTLTWAYTSPIMKLDPVWSEALVDETVIVQMLEALARANPTANGIEPAIAEKWEVSADGLTYTYHIRPNIKFHNGAAVTAADVVASLNRVKTMGDWMWMLAESTKLTAVDPSTVEIVLNAKVASFVARMAVPANAIFPASEITKIGKQEFTQPIGTGPFKFKEWVHNDHLTLTKNDSYWDMAPDNLPYPYVDQFTAKLVSEVTTAVLQVQTGQAQGMDRPDYSQINSLKSGGQGKLEIYPQQQVYFMVINLKKPPFDDVKVRQAMSLALDRTVFVQRVTAGLATAADSFFPKGTLDWDPNLTLPYDVSKAKQLMATSKYPQGAKGLLLQYGSGDTVGNDNAVIAQQMWSQIGLQFTIQEVDPSTLANNWYVSNYVSISGYQWTNPMADPEDLVNFFLITPRMNTGYQPAASTVELVKAAQQELDPAKRQQDFYQLQQIYNTDVGGTISLYYTSLASYMGKNIQGHFISPLGFPYFWETWISKS